MTMQEKIAWAVLAAEVADDPEAWNFRESKWGMQELEEYGFLRSARAALQAMLEPSERMIEEGGDLEASDGFSFVTDRVAKNVFCAMIQTALDGK